MVSPRFSRRTALQTAAAGAVVLHHVRSSRRETLSSTTTGIEWLSGAGDPQASGIANGGFGTWRGSQVTYARVWADASLRDMAGLWMMDAYLTAGWSGTLDIACGGPRDGYTWASAAAGGMDDIWRHQCRTVLAKWGQLSGVHLSMSHEMNGNWYPWSVNSGSTADFKTAWARWYDIVQTELVSKGKSVKVVLDLNSDTTSGLSMLSMIPDTRYFDVVGVDFYSMWPDLTTQTIWNQSLLTKKSDGAPRGIQAWFDYAKAIGKPVAFPEWGLNTQSDSDNPFFISQMRNIFAANGCMVRTLPAPGQMAGEAYFNHKARSRLWPTTSMPGSAAMYKSVVFGS